MKWKTMQPCVVNRRNQKVIPQNWGLCFDSYFCGRQCSKLQTGPLFLKFFKLVLSGIGKMMQVEVLINFAKIIPETLYVFPKNLGLQNDSFIKYAVFLKCRTLYNFDECVCQRPNGEVVPAKCSHVSYPRHPHQAQKEAMWFPSNENYEVKSRKDILVS